MTCKTDHQFSYIVLRPGRKCDAVLPFGWHTVCVRWQGGTSSALCTIDVYGDLCDPKDRLQHLSADGS